jgi:hypothetical protein
MTQEKLYPYDWRCLPRAPSAHADNDKDVWVTGAYTFLRDDTGESATANVLEALRRILAACGAVPLSRSPSRREVRAVVREGTHVSVAFDIFANRAQIATGIPHEVAANAYAYLENSFPIQVSCAIIGVSDNVDVPVARRLTNLPMTMPHWQRRARAGCPMDNHHYFAARPAAEDGAGLRQRRTVEAEEKERRRLARVYTPKYSSPPLPDWVLRQPSPLPAAGSALAPLPRCLRCAQFERPSSVSATSHACAALSDSAARRSSRPPSSNSTAAVLRTEALSGSVLFPTAAPRESTPRRLLRELEEMRSTGRK